ncbi:MAG: DUF4177 domain-containing protein [Oscillospiraceae bacterium]|nr:DUF4177 domain-containing protein [Oscillospiraceae bacterium]
MKQYKIIKVYYDYKLASLEKVINDMAKDGWELVCMSPEAGANTLKLLITFCREEAQQTTQGE